MKRSIIAAAALAITFSVPTWAADAGAPAQTAAPVQNTSGFKQRKVQILKEFNERIAAMQQDRKCVQATKDENDLRGCREKSRDRRRAEMEQRRAQRNSMHASGGPQAEPQSQAR